MCLPGFEPSGQLLCEHGVWADVHCKPRRCYGASVAEWMQRQTHLPDGVAGMSLSSFLRALPARLPPLDPEEAAVAARSSEDG